MRNRFLFVLFLTVAGHAQVLEGDFHYGFGTSELAFNSVPGFAVSFYPVKNFGASIGLEYAFHWVTKNDENLSGTNSITTDSEGDSLVFKYAMASYEEERFAKILQIPILLKYNGEDFYTSAGVKIGVYQNATVKSTYENLSTEGYYPQYDLTLTAPSYQGFGAQNDSSFKIKIKTKSLIMLALEGGIKYKLTDNFYLFAGLFADYSFNKGFSRDLPPFVERVENQVGADLRVSDGWSNWRPWTLGVQLKIAFKGKIDKDENEKNKDDIKEKNIALKDTNHNVAVIEKKSPPPVITNALEPQPTQSVAPPHLNIVLPTDTVFSIPELPAFLLGEPQFVFYYPENRTSPSDSLHLKIIAQIADSMRASVHTSMSSDAKPQNLHCVGYSENLASAFAAYESAHQRAIRIRYTLSTFYGIDKNRIFTYSQGSKIPPHRTNAAESNNRAECYLIP
ncbi:hypothetical protein AGMMS49938_16630 [Fibrobacterales bacterium]|nr:hypothetical protein AGMMS49938_16630 [Fibrobacterales bacterium]